MKKLFNTKVDAIGLSVFRMFYSVILFFELHQLFTFRSIIYDKDPFVYKGELDVTFLFQFWFVIIICLFLGLFTRYMTLLNYIFSVIIFSSASHFEYHVFYAYVGINFLLMFMPISRVLSIDSLIEKVKYTSIGRPYAIDRKVLKINYIILVFVAIALVYFDSIFHKFSGKMWMDGLGVWLPSSLPMVTWCDTSSMLNQKGLMVFLGYLVMVFETVFIFLFWFKKFRLPFFILGVFFHIGILIAYPIPWFALTAVAVYLLLLPIGYWLKLATLFKVKKPRFKFYYDVECPLCNKVVVIIKHFDIFNAVECITVQGNFQNDAALQNIDEETLLINIHGVTHKGKVSVGFWAYVQLFKAMGYTYPLGLIISLPGISFLGQKIYKFVAGNRITERCTAENCAMPVFTNPVSETDDLLIKGFNQLAVTRFFWKCILWFMIVAQMLLIYFNPYVQSHMPFANYISKVLAKPYEYSKVPLQKYFGLTTHPVFMFKNHFEDYKFIFKVTGVDATGKEILVPILNENGMPKNSYANGALWVSYTFRVNSPYFKLQQFEDGIVPYLKYFENDNQLSIHHYNFYIKEIQPKEDWRQNALREHMAQPWVKAGEANLNGNSYKFSWNDSMKGVLKKQSK